MLQYILIPVTHYQQNCSLIWCDQTNEAALIDPGGEPERLLKALSERGLSLAKIVLTHGHHCHAPAFLLLLPTMHLLSFCCVWLCLA